MALKIYFSIDLDKIITKLGEHYCISLNKVCELVKKTILEKYWADVRAEDEGAYYALVSEWMITGKHFYDEYIQSSTWKERRKLALERAGNKCYFCGESKNLHVHHTNYDNLGNEYLYDLEVLCPDCHKRIHRLKSVLCSEWFDLDGIKADLINSKESNKHASDYPESVGILANLFFNVFDVKRIIPSHIPHIAKVFLDTIDIRNGAQFLSCALSRERKQRLTRKPRIEEILNLTK